MKSREKPVEDNAPVTKKPTPDHIKNFRKSLLGWYDSHKRALPWRYTDGETPDPYKVWLSEVMLQQTTVGAVIPYFLKFIRMWPDVETLAKAPQNDIMNEWAGLGYYSRARNLHACAQIIANDHKGLFPDNQKDLKKLPGIGEYTSAAIRTIAFNKPATVVDGNVERIMARYFLSPAVLPKGKKELGKLAGPFFEEETKRPGDLAQAFMDLGATICTPKSPDCPQCPISKTCAAYKKGVAEHYPLKETGKEKPEKFGYAYILLGEDDTILVQRRPEKGMLGGMLGLPTSEWVCKTQKNPPPHLSGINALQSTSRSINHSFTHFNLELEIITGAAKTISNEDVYFRFPVKDLEAAGFPTLFRKCLSQAEKSGYI